MKSESTRADEERLKILQPRVDRGQATVEEIIECATIAWRMSVGEKSPSPQGASEILREGLRRFPNEPDLLYELAIKLRLDGQHGSQRLLRRALHGYKAQGRFDSADHTAKDLADDFFYDGCDALDAKDNVQAERLFRKAIGIYPFHADSWGHLGIIYEERGKWIEASRCYWQGLQLGRIPCHETELNDRWVGKVTRCAGEARTHYWGQLNTRPYLRALYNWAQLLYLRKEFRPALAYAEESLLVNPNDNTGARYLVYSILRVLGRKSEMRRLTRQYRGESLSDEADELEIRCFRSRIGQPRKEGKPN